MTNFKLITGEKAIYAAAEVAYKATDKAAMSVHVVLCSCLAHVQQHGNTVVLEKVFAKLHQSMNMRGVRAFIAKFSNLRAQEDDAGNVIFRKPGKKPIAIQMDDAKANPYWTIQAVINANNALWDVEKRLLSLIGQARFHAGKGDVKDSKAATAIILDLETIAKARKLDLSSVPSIADGKAAKGTDATVTTLPTVVKTAKPNASKPKAKETPANANEPHAPMAKSA